MNPLSVRAPLPGERDTILARYAFDLDGFQRTALDAFDAGEHVIVAAPTGSGKTVVAEYGVARAHRAGLRSAYTAPIKALSNQKYRDLVEIHGAESVGLLTGDTTINHGASILVMTTEVVRNMIYADPHQLDDLGVVVLDEVHFLQDAYRGPVWEEVIIHLPAHIRLICLSATVSNHGQLGEWIRTVRGPTRVVIEHRRPVSLENNYLVADRSTDELRLMPVLIDGQPNRACFRFDPARSGARGRRHPHGRGLAMVPDRLLSLRLLAEREMLPAIWFIFSRNQCDTAARACRESGLRLTTESERARIVEIAEQRLRPLRGSDLGVLGLEGFLAGLEAGIAAHHAGMLPAFKEVVEACFVEGLVKIVFATETLALGINMPARTVVIEKLTKFTGDHHQALSPGEYTQLTGRAGRRGIDEHGAAVVLWNPFVDFGQIVELVQSRTFHLRSAFRPTYNMAANLVRTHSRAEARHVLTMSFAQFQSDADVLRTQSRLHRLEQRACEQRAEADSPFGDIEDYRRTHLHRREDALESDGVTAALRALRPGDVIRIDAGKHHCPAAVVAIADRRTGIRISVVTPGADLVRLSAEQFQCVPTSVGQVRLPSVHAPERRTYREEVARRLRTTALERPLRGDRLRRDAAHRVTADPDLPMRLRAAERADGIDRKIAQLQRQARRARSGLADQFDAVVDLLADLGYINAETWQLTPGGESLSHIFHESDLLIAECLRRGVLDGCGPAELACLVSMFVYEHRSPDEPPAPWFPDVTIARRAEQIMSISNELAVRETRAGLGVHRTPDPTFGAVAFAWVAGEGFAELVEAEELTGGDFVRTIRQLIDLLTQISRVATDPDTAHVARRAATSAHREVIADSALISDPEVAT